MVGCRSRSGADSIVFNRSPVQTRLGICVLGFGGGMGFVWGCSSVRIQCGIVRTRSCAIKALRASNGSVTDGVRVDSGVNKSSVLMISRAQHHSNIRRTHDGRQRNCTASLRDHIRGQAIRHTHGVPLECVEPASYRAGLHELDECACLLGALSGSTASSPCSHGCGSVWLAL